jgi:hypothetical protein
MLKVLSTKLPVDQVERFQEVAEAQGETRSSQLKRLVTEFLQSADKVDELATADRPNQVAVLDKGLTSKHLRQDPHQKPTETLTSASGLDSSLPGNAGVDHSLNPEPLSTSRQPVYHNTQAARSDNPPEQSSGIGALICLGLALLILWLTPVDTAARTPKRLAQGIGPGIYRQRYLS